ncbi:phage holin family protein [Vreelandella venusta]|uniref:phage holin family protein n=2 Tax=Pseudomonadota TaxID=1224 RepID=UPI003AA7C0D6
MQRVSRMPPDPHDHKTWELALWLQVNAPWLVAGIVAIFMVLLRAYLDKVKLTKKDVAEAIICGAFVMTSRPVMASMGISDDWAIFIGVVTGFLGVRFFRPAVEAMARHVLNSRGGK